ncbi:hypothetical protein NL676_000127 [Syzygium grande]|nr:hypothetical protein NL676_000127 [Syzygium grande]
MKRISICSVLLLVLFLIAGNGSMMAQGSRTMEPGQGFCDKEYRATPGACTNEKCLAECRTAYGSTASGFCKSEKGPNDVCVCHYPC